jgi:hypothetical protein
MEKGTFVSSYGSQRYFTSFRAIERKNAVWNYEPVFEVYFLDPICRDIQG